MILFDFYFIFKTVIFQLGCCIQVHLRLTDYYFVDNGSIKRLQFFQYQLYPQYHCSGFLEN